MCKIRAKSAHPILLGEYGKFNFFYSHTHTHTHNQSVKQILSSRLQITIYGFYGSKRVVSRPDVPFWGIVDDKSCLGGPNHPKTHFLEPFNAKPIIETALRKSHVNGATMLKLYSYIGITVKNCCFITMCKAHSKVTHIKQQIYFHHLKRPGYNTEFLLYPRPFR